MDGSLSPVRLPLDTFRLAGRLFLPLAFFYSLGALVHQGVILAAVHLAEPRGWHAYLGFGVLSFGVLVTLTAYIAMLTTAGRALGTHETEARSLDERERRLVDAIAHTLLPFLVFYSAWNLFVDDVRAFQRLSSELGPQIDLDATALVAELFDFNILVVAITLGVFALKVACERLYERFNLRVLGVANSALECMWMFFGIISLGNWIGQGVDWLTGRVVWADLTGLIGGLPPVESLKQAAQAVAPYLPELKDGLVQPLIWLAMAAVVHSSSMTDEIRVIQGTRVEAPLSSFWQRLPAPVQAVAEFFSRGFRDKYTPLANGLRLVLRVGAPFYLTFCLMYVALEALAAVGFMALTRLLGPHEVLWWQMWEGAVLFPVDLVHEVLRICLIAVAFDLALRQAGGPAAATEPVAPSPGPATAAPLPAGR
ncbi:hypothetical protein [Sphaerisporangium sp. TRM90804]|uniref:hypothetical protein n=1 Tax=Sphaerisporangium sp. TRM90804 TaxID=3031113 RepID=UPI00244D7728|nr:hypothetical protein [Sphaerisporangium sp. TRM90804]MDH2425713.1 hypothetical protein [Sphaerisporangium sp. TRM90804]